MPKFALTAQIESSMKQWNEKKEEKETMEREANRTKFTAVSMVFTGVGIKDGILLHHIGLPLGLRNAVFLVSCVLFCIFCVFVF